MDEEDRALMSESVGCTPYIVDPVHICGARRPRFGRHGSWLKVLA